MAKKILGVIAALIVVLVAVIATRPGSYRVERSLAMSAPIATIHSYLSDFNHFGEWSPWEHLDPAMKKDIQGLGQGATYHWSGNGDAGEGRMTITKSEAPGKLDMSLEFIRPFASQAETGFVIVPEGEGSRVTWWMAGTNNFMSKAFGLFVNLEEMIGSDYEKGLAAMKPKDEARAEAEAELTAKASAAASPEPKLGEPAATPTDAGEIGTP